MTRRDYQIIAQALRESYEKVLPEHRGAVIAATEQIALALEQDNPRFSRGKFIHVAYEGEVAA